MNDFKILREKIGRSGCWVIKIGSAVATNDGVGLNHSRIEHWVSQIQQLHKEKKQIVIVTSGSVAEGAAQLGWQSRPKDLSKLQAAAAIGQIGLANAWAIFFKQKKIKTAQVLLTHDDLVNRQRYINARTTLTELLQLGVCPIINENDTVATSELSFGDNDTLAGLVCNLIEADLMVILTDQPGLKSSDPKVDPSAILIENDVVESSNLDIGVSSGGAWGRGGMITKLRAARLAARSATSTIIASGETQNVLRDISKGLNIGTFLFSNREKIAARKQWLGSVLTPRGDIFIDLGAANAIVNNGGSLLAVGIKSIGGSFERGDVVTVRDNEDVEIARGLVNYSYLECEKIMGTSSKQIEDFLGFTRGPEVIHRDNLFIEVG